MAMEAIKIITGTGEPLVGRLMLYDGRAARFTELEF
jgi:molybdopterin/thiamine biosynthesis adenylyltransferase